MAHEDRITTIVDSILTAWVGSQPNSREVSSGIVRTVLALKPRDTKRTDEDVLAYAEWNPDVRYIPGGVAYSSPLRAGKTKAAETARTRHESGGKP